MLEALLQTVVLPVVLCGVDLPQLLDSDPVDLLPLHPSLPRGVVTEPAALHYAHHAHPQTTLRQFWKVTGYFGGFLKKMTKMARMVLQCQDMVPGCLRS